MQFGKLLNKHQLYNNIENIVLIRLSHDKVNYLITLIHINTRPWYIDSFQNRAVSSSTETKNELKIEINSKYTEHVFIIFYQQHDL